MELIKEFFYYAVHTFTGCSEEDFEHLYGGAYAVCRKCGRNHFNFKKFGG